MKTSMAALVVAAALLAGCAEPVPAERSAYVGEWRASGMELEIGGDGQVSYHRTRGGGETSIDAPLKRFDGDDFLVGIGPLTTRFVVTVPPHRDGAVWKMTVDGVEMTRVEGGGGEGGASETIGLRSSRR